MRFRPAVYSSCLLIGCLCIINGSSKLWAQPPAEIPAVTVVLAPIIEGEVESSLYLVGTAYPLISTTVSAQVAGNIERFTIDEGTFVEAGEVLCQLEKTLKLIEVKRAKAQLKQTRAELSKLATGSREEEINQAKARADNKKAILEKLKLNKERMEDLFSKGMVTLEQKQNANLDYEQGLAELREAEAALNLTINGSRVEDIAAAKATVAIREAELAQAEDNLEKTNITAPFHGSITKKYKELGEWVKAGEAIVEIINIEKIMVHTNVSEKDIKYITQGQPAEIVFDAYPDKVYQGSVRDIISQADLKSRTFPIKIEIDNKEHKLYAGMFTRLKLILGKQKQALLAPKDAILRTDGGQYLFIVKNSTVHRIEIKTGREKGDLMEVEGQLKSGDMAVITNNEVLRDKMQVIVAP